MDFDAMRPHNNNENEILKRHGGFYWDSYEDETHKPQLLQTNEVRSISECIRDVLEVDCWGFCEINKREEEKSWKMLEMMGKKLLRDFTGGWKSSGWVQLMKSLRLGLKI